MLEGSQWAALLQNNATTLMNLLLQIIADRLGVPPSDVDIVSFSIGSLRMEFIIRRNANQPLTDASVRTLLADNGVMAPMLQYYYQATGENSTGVLSVVVSEDYPADPCGNDCVATVAAVSAVCALAVIACLAALVWCRRRHRVFWDEDSRFGYFWRNPVTFKKNHPPVDPATSPEMMGTWWHQTADDAEEPHRLPPTSIHEPTASPLEHHTAVAVDSDVDEEDVFGTGTHIETDPPAGTDEDQLRQRLTDIDDNQEDDEEIVITAARAQLAVDDPHHHSDPATSARTIIDSTFKPLQADELHFELSGDGGGDSAVVHVAPCGEDDDGEVRKLFQFTEEDHSLSSPPDVAGRYLRDETDALLEKLVASRRESPVIADDANVQPPPAATRVTASGIPQIPLAANGSPPPPPGFEHHHTVHNTEHRNATAGAVHSLLSSSSRFSGFGGDGGGSGMVLPPSAASPRRNTADLLMDAVFLGASRIASLIRRTSPDDSDISRGANSPRTAAPSSVLLEVAAPSAPLAIDIAFEEPIEESPVASIRLPGLSGSSRAMQTTYGTVSSVAPTAQHYFTPQQQRRRESGELMSARNAPPTAHRPSLTQQRMPSFQPLRSDYVDVTEDVRRAGYASPLHTTGSTSSRSTSGSSSSSTPVVIEHSRHHHDATSPTSFEDEGFEWR